MQALSEQVSVAGQIELAHLQQLKDQGFSTVLCHRPDAENPPELQHQHFVTEAKRLGMSFYYLPITPGVFPPETVAEVKAILVKAPGKVFGYCASGRRAATVWEMAR